MDTRVIAVITVIVINMDFSGVHSRTTTAHSNGTTASTYASLRHYLLSRDATSGRVPPGGGVVPVIVEVSLKPVDTLDVNDVKQVVSTTVALNFNWTDPELAWDPSPEGPYPNIHSVELPVDEMWTPLVYFGNGASDDEREMSLGKSAFVTAAGSVLVLKSFVLETTCTMDLQKYPFDRQECTITRMMYSSVPVDVRAAESKLLNDEMGGELLGTSAEWIIRGMRERRYELPTLQGAYGINVIVSIERKTAFFVISFITPIVMTSYMNTLVFLIPVEAGEKISYLVSIFVSNAVFLSFFTGEMPQGLDSVPLVMFLVLGIMAESGILIVINSIILTRFHGNQTIDPPTTSTPETGTACFDQSELEAADDRPGTGNAAIANAVHPRHEGLGRRPDDFHQTNKTSMINRRPCHTDKGRRLDVFSAGGKLKTKLRNIRIASLEGNVFLFFGSLIFNTAFVASFLVAMTR